MRAAIPILTMALTTLASRAAVAQSVPYQWGVGPTVGTTVLPYRFPAAFPKIVKQDGGFEKVRADASMGVQGLYWAGDRSRLAADLGFGFGGGYRELHGIAKYDFMAPTQALDWFVGGGLGAGHAWWSKGSRTMWMPYFPARVEAGVMVRFPVFAVQATAYGQLDIPGLTTYSGSTGIEEEVGWGFYGHMGVELAAFYGRFDR